jgi:hypothetical protein
VPADVPEELLENGTTGVICNTRSRTHIQTIKKQSKGLQLPSGAIHTRIAFHSQKKVLATLPTRFVTKHAFKKPFSKKKSISYKKRISWSLSLCRDTWSNFGSCLLVRFYQLKKLEHAFARQSAKRAKIDSHAMLASKPHPIKS